MQWLAQPRKVGLTDFTGTWIQRVLELHRDLPFSLSIPAPYLSFPCVCFPSHSSSCSERSPLPDYVLIASRPSALGKAFPPLGLVYPISVFCCRKTNQGTSTEPGTLVLGQWYPFPPSRKEWSHSFCSHINCLCLCFCFFSLKIIYFL